MAGAWRVLGEGPGRRETPRLDLPLVLFSSSHTPVIPPQGEESVDYMIKHWSAKLVFKPARCGAVDPASLGSSPCALILMVGLRNLLIVAL